MSKQMPASRKNLSTILLLVVIFLVAISGVCFIAYYFSYERSEAKASAVLHTQGSALLFESFFTENRLVTEDSGETITPQQQENMFQTELLKDRMIRYDDIHEEIQRSFILVHSGNKYIVLSDSKPMNASDHLADGSVYPMTDVSNTELVSGRTIVFDSPQKPDTYTVLVPMFDESDGRLHAAYGIEYSSSALLEDTWQSLQTRIMMLIAFLLLLFGIYYALLKNESLRETATRLRVSEKRFRDVFEQAPIGIAVVSNYTNMKRMNREFLRILGRTEEDKSKIDWMAITHPDDLEKDVQEFERFKAGEISAYSMEKRYLRNDGVPVWVNIQVNGLQSTIEEGTRADAPEHVCIVQDIGERKAAIDALQESERSKSVLLSNLPGMAYRCRLDPAWTMLFLSDGCLELTGYKPEEIVSNRDLSYNDIISPEHRSRLWEVWNETLAAKAVCRSEYEITTKTGERKWVLEIGRGIFAKDDQVEALEGIVIDITNSKQNLDQIKYMNDHDFLTGLYNRKFFEEEKDRLSRESIIPVSVLNADINGVRLINDAFGQAQGDFLIRKTAEILLSCQQEGETLARIGGDEFSILMPNTDENRAEARIEEILAACEIYNQATLKPEQKINLTIASGTKSSPEHTIDEADKEADDAVRKRKLFERSSTQSSLLTSIMATLYARSQETEEHAERIASLCREIGNVLMLPQKSMDNLALFSMLHDIGKIGIEDRILNKPGRLTDEEWLIMKRHPEIGFRIVMSAPELEEIAQLVLSHHERWDGQGYPRGLKGEEIPQIARILSVVDAYDAMTENRVYRKAMPHEEALAEIRRNAGTQFDPHIVDIFLSIIGPKECELQPAHQEDQ